MKIYIVTGEKSGDLHASKIVSSLMRKSKNIFFRGWGGDNLKESGVDIVKHISETSFMGFTSVIKNVFSIVKNIRFCKKDILSYHPDALLLVDYPGFNLKIAKFAKKRGIKVFYYIPPKVWAWNTNRINILKKYVDHIIVSFPFEVDFYKKYNMKVNYFGNIILDEVNKIKESNNSSDSVIALLPGSRKQEIDLILPKMLSVVSAFPNYNFTIGATKLFSEKYYESFLKNKDVNIVYDETYALLNRAEVALVTSGTATLETAFLNVPQVVCYKTNPITYFLAKLFIKTNFISLVNILMKKEVVNEIIQEDLNKFNLIDAINHAINNKKLIQDEYQKLRELFNSSNQLSSDRIADFLIKSI